MDEPVLRQFATTLWAQKRLPEDLISLAVVTLLITYHYRCLLVDTIRSNSSAIQDELNVTLLPPLYIWPSYRTWILGEFPARSRVNQGEAIHWLLNTDMREAGFAELEIEEPENRLLSYLELKQNTTNLSRWINDGFERLYHAIYLAVVQTLPDQRDSSVVEGRSKSPSDSEQDDQGRNQDSGISRAEKMSIISRFNEANKDENFQPNSPFLQRYLDNIEVSRTFLDLKKNSRTDPPLIQIARLIIDRQLKTSNLDIGLQALTMDCCRIYRIGFVLKILLTKVSLSGALNFAGGSFTAQIPYLLSRPCWMENCFRSQVRTGMSSFVSN